MRQIKIKLVTEFKDFSEFGFKTVIFKSKGDMHVDIYNAEDLEEYYRGLYRRV